MAKKQKYTCGRCGYRADHVRKCPSCKITLEDECRKCRGAQGNCVCRIHGKR